MSLTTPPTITAGPASPAPIDADERLHTLDVLRGLALAGMILVHFHQRLETPVTGVEDLIGWFVWIFVEQKDDSGKVVKWGFEGKVPNQLIRLGITPSVLKPGIEVTVTGHPARDASQNFGEVLEVTLPDGKIIKP